MKENKERDAKIKEWGMAIAKLQSMPEWKTYIEFESGVNGLFLREIAAENPFPASKDGSPVEGRYEGRMRFLRGEMEAMIRLASQRKMAVDLYQKSEDGGE
jgi:hypothetical protein